MQLLHQTCRSRIDRLNDRRRPWRLVGKVRSPAAVQRVDEQRDVVGAAEAVSAHLATFAERFARTGLHRERTPRWFRGALGGLSLEDARA
jgi:hypothetical protein